MGYYTDFTLSMSEKTKSVEKAATKAGMQCVLGYILEDRDITGDTTQMKWYDYNEDMLEFSKKFPKTLFILDGVGEEHIDMWRCYYKNGKVQEETANITFGEYDPEKME